LNLPANTIPLRATVTGAFLAVVAILILALVGTGVLEGLLSGLGKTGH
jgi:hypothetical protein